MGPAVNICRTAVSKSVLPEGGMFPLQQGYGLELEPEPEPYTSENSRAPANIVATHVRQGSIKKVLFVECKSMRAKTTSVTAWGNVKDRHPQRLETHEAASFASRINSSTSLVKPFL